MKIKKLLIGLVLVFCISAVFGKDYSEEFQRAFQNSDYEKVESILKNWEKEDSNNPEMLIAYFNYYLNRKMESVMTMGNMDDGRYGLYDRKTFKQEDVKTGVSYLDKALKSNPDRLDIHFGKCSSLLKSENYEEACAAIIDVLETSIKVNNKWKWTNGKAITDDGESVLFSGINDYCPVLFTRLGVENPNFKKVINSIEKLYPNNNIGLNWCARFYSQSGDNKKAISYLKKAYELDKSDYVVLGNLGYLYELENNYKEARKCYETMSKMDNPTAKQYAKEYLDAIKDKK